jgi:hypothetical protein
MPQLTEAQRLYSFVEKAKKETRKAFLSVDGVTTIFRINPQQFHNTGEAVQMDVQTLDGFGLVDFGVKPNVMTMQGFTGLDGRDGPGGLYALERFRPLLGRRNKLILFGFPARFEGVRYCYLRTFTDSITIDKHLYNQYDIQLVEYGPHVNAPAVRVPSSFSPLIS